MNEKFKNIRKKFKQLINEKNNLKFHRSKSRSFFEINSNYIQGEEEKKNDELNLRKNSINMKRNINALANKKENDAFNNTYNGINSILSTKFNILKSSLDKLQLLLENNIINETKSTNNIIENIHNIKNYYKNEIIVNESNIVDNNLKNVKREYMKEFKKRKSNKLDSDIEVTNVIEEFQNELKENINESVNKISSYNNNQINYFNNIDKKVKEQFDEINTNNNNDIQYSNKKYNLIMENVNSFNYKLYMIEKEENINRENFKNSINEILNLEIDNLKSGEFTNSLDLLKSREKSFK